MTFRNPLVFFAVPCGEFYSAQADIIRRVAETANIDAIIAEDDVATKELWDKIITDIERADLFVADISSGSPNIILELGYAIKAKGKKNTGVFISNNISVPSDLRGIVLQKYSSFSNFQESLIQWLCRSIPRLDSEEFSALEVKLAEFSEDFCDQDMFLKRWSLPPGGSSILTHEGMRFGESSFPIISTTLGILRDCEVEFKARIDRQRIGWVVKGTKTPQLLVPSFCVMFNLDTDGHVLPHIWNASHPDPNHLYQRFEVLADDITIDWDDEGWFTLKTIVRGEIIELEHNGDIVYRVDFSQAPLATPYHEYELPKQGQVGFRCSSMEEATVRFIRVREI